VHRAEKWPRFSLTQTSGSAPNDALLKESSIGCKSRFASGIASLRQRGWSKDDLVHVHFCGLTDREGYRLRHGQRRHGDLMLFADRRRSVGSVTLAGRSVSVGPGEMIVLRML
jgi:hypothetical protein